MRRIRFLSSIVFGVTATAWAGSGASSLIPSPVPRPAISGVQVTPSIPTASTEVSVTVHGWAPCNLAIYDHKLRIEGLDIRLELYWRVAWYGLGDAVVQQLSIGNPTIVPAAIRQYEHTESLGILEPGLYTLNVVNCGSMDGSATTRFTVFGIPGTPDPDPIPLPEPPEWPDANDTSAPDLPGFEIKHVPWSDVGNIKEGISQLHIKPSSPKSSDDVSVTITGWKPNSELVVERTSLRIEGNGIWLDLYWHTQPLLPPPPTVADLPAGPSQNMSGLIGQMQNCSLAMAPPVTVIQYDITPYWGVPFEYTERLGTFSPGTYILHVTSHNPVSGSDSTSFTVL